MYIKRRAAAYRLIAPVIAGLFSIVLLLCNYLLYIIHNYSYKFSSRVVDNPGISGVDYSIQFNDGSYNYTSNHHDNYVWLAEVCKGVSSRHIIQ